MRRRTLLALPPLLVTASVARAHSELRESSPADGAVLAAPPAELLLRFNERVQVTGLALHGPTGPARRLAPATLSAAAATERVALPALAPGAWRLDWAAISADGHPIRGSIRFTIRP